MTERVVRSRGWRTTDEDEVERRRQRAAAEPLAVEALEPRHRVFGTFRVRSEAGRAYEVEIRSLTFRFNSCDCPDYEINGLGTCKHVEAVLANVGRSRAARAGNPRIEVFLLRTGERPQVRVEWPPGRRPARHRLARFFSADGTLRDEPVDALPELARELASLPPRAREEVRLSRHLLPWAEEQRRRAGRRTAREQFLAAVHAGRESLDPLRHPLPAGYKNLEELHRRLAPVLLRRRKSEVEGQIPPRLEKHYFVPMEDEQAARYADYEQRVAQLAAQARRRTLTPEELDKLQRWLSCMRMLCDTPYILDPDCRICPKLGELAEVLEDLLSDQRAKVLVFSEWERMLELARELAQEMGVGFAWHTGSVPQARRRAEVRRFKEDPACRLFLSTDSGGVGLNLQAANAVVNLDLPWNPARLEQRIARAWRKHQTRPVQVVHLVTEDSIEHRMIPLLAGKQALADGVLDGRGDLSAMPLPSGRRALVERLEALTGLGTPPAAARDERRPALAAPDWADLLGALGDGLLRLETVTGRDGRETLLAVVAGPAERGRIESLVSRRNGEGLPPHLEVIDRVTFETIERLVAAGLLQFTAADRRVLETAAARAERDRERDRRLALARETFAPAERKIRMAGVLAGGGFPV